MRVASIGEILWDVFGEQERLGGAPFNFAAHAARLGHDVVFLSAVGEDERGREAIRLAQELNVSTEFLHTVQELPTGHVTVVLDEAGVPSFTIHRPAAYDLFRLSPEELQKLAEFSPDVVAFGTLHQTTPAVKAQVRLVLDACPGARRFYDVNLRQDSYNVFLLEDLMLEASVVKLNREEMEQINRLFGLSFPSLEKACRYWCARYGWEIVAVTLGEEGCAVLAGEEWVESPGYAVKVVDTVGSGDAFAAAFVHGLAEGWPLAEVADFANRVGAVVASKAGAVPAWTLEECQALKRR